MPRTGATIGGGMPIIVAMAALPEPADTMTATFGGIRITINCLMTRILPSLL